jgi:pentatricopeptide repeat protein
VLGCLSKSKTEQSCVVAEDLLNEMERLGSKHRESVRPNVVSYACLIDAYANVGDAESAERILDRLVKSYSYSQDPRLEPATHCFNSLLKAFRKSSFPPGRAESLLNRMRRLHKAAGIPVKPDTVSYNILMDIWADSGKSESSKRVLGILTNMMKSQDVSTIPTTQSYNIALKCLVRHGQCDEAERLLGSMDEGYATDAHKVSPDTTSFNILLGSFLARNDSEAAMALFNRMLSAYEKGDDTMKPNLATFQMILRGLGGENIEYREEVLRRLKELYPDRHVGRAT